MVVPLGLLDEAMVQVTELGLDQELQTVAPGVTRDHLVVLCCAHSVVELVEEVARNLRGLGFAVEVVCGAEARTALLGRGSDGDKPTIYVVCVQGTLKEQVLKPLRQALATHGGPNQHLFVAVLDLALPLAMVGQIRRFSEALERPRRRGGAGLDERRQWREQLGPNTERIATRSYRALEVVSRADTIPPPGVDTVRRTGPQAVIGSARPADIGVTAKYRTVSGALPTATTAAEEATPRKPRRARAPKVRVQPVAGAPQITGDTAVAGAPSRSLVGARPSVPTSAAPDVAPVLHQLGEDAPAARSRRSPWPIAIVGGVGLLAAASVGLWMTGTTARIVAAVQGEPRADTTPTPAPSTVAIAGDAVTPSDARAPAATPTPTDEPSPTLPPSPTAAPIPAITPTPAGAPTPSDGPTPADAPTPTEAPTPTDPPTPADVPTLADPPTPADAPTPSADPEPAPTVGDDVAPIDPALGTAVDTRRLRVTDTLYVTTTKSSAATWQQARAACDSVKINGVAGFRLPYRRELQALDTAALLRPEPHWSRTVPENDQDSAYVLHPSTGQLTVWAKVESAAAVCVRPR